MIRFRALRQDENRWPIIIVIGYWLALWLATHWPNPQLPSAWRHHDKLLHLLAYAGLSPLVMFAIDRQTWRLEARHMAMLLAGLTLLAGTDELTQNFVPGRRADLSDFGFDLAGVVLGLVIGRLLLRRRFTRSAPET
jgi:VanZ family protein